MRLIRTFIAVTALGLVVAACGDDDASTTTTLGGGSATTVSTSGGLIGGGNGSIVFEITGDYEASGEFPFIPAASAFSNGGWSATFSEGGEAIIAMNTIPGSSTVSYGDGTAVVSGGEQFGCTINLTQNDASGFAGSFLCDNLDAFLNSGAAIVVDFSGTFTGHP